MTLSRPGAYRALPLARSQSRRGCALGVPVYRLPFSCGPLPPHCLGANYSLVGWLAVVPTEAAYDSHCANFSADAQMCGRESNPIAESPVALVSSSRLRVAAAPPRRRTSDPRRRQAASAAKPTQARCESSGSRHEQRRTIVKRPAHSVPSRSFGSSTTLPLTCGLKTHRRAYPRRRRSGSAGYSIVSGARAPGVPPSRTATVCALGAGHPR